MGGGAGLGAALGEDEAEVCRLGTHFLSQVQVLRTEVGPSLQLAGHWAQWDSWDHDDGGGGHRGSRAHLKTVFQGGRSGPYSMSVRFGLDYCYFGLQSPTILCLLAGL